MRSHLHYDFVCHAQLDELLVGYLCTLFLFAVTDEKKIWVPANTAYQLGRNFYDAQIPFVTVSKNRQIVQVEHEILHNLMMI